MIQSEVFDYNIKPMPPGLIQLITESVLISYSSVDFKVLKDFESRIYTLVDDLIVEGEKYCYIANQNYPPVESSMVIKDKKTNIPYPALSVSNGSELWVELSGFSSYCDLIRILKRDASGKTTKKLSNLDKYHINKRKEALDNMPVLFSFVPSDVIKISSQSCLIQGSNTFLIRGSSVAESEVLSRYRTPDNLINSIVAQLNIQLSGIDVKPLLVSALLKNPDFSEFLQIGSEPFIEINSGTKKFSLTNVQRAAFSQQSVLGLTLATFNYVMHNDSLSTSFGGHLKNIQKHGEALRTLKGRINENDIYASLLDWDIGAAYLDSLGVSVGVGYDLDQLIRLTTSLALKSKFIMIDTDNSVNPSMVDVNMIKNPLRYSLALNKNFSVSKTGSIFWLTNLKTGSKYKLYSSLTSPLIHLEALVSGNFQYLSGHYNQFLELLDLISLNVAGRGYVIDLSSGAKIPEAIQMNNASLAIYYRPFIKAKGSLLRRDYD